MQKTRTSQTESGESSDSFGPASKIPTVFYKYDLVEPIKKQVGHNCTDAIAIAISSKAGDNSAKMNELIGRVSKALSLMEFLFNESVKANGAIQIMNDMPFMGSDAYYNSSKMSFELFMYLSFGGSDVDLYYTEDKSLQSLPSSKNGIYLKGDMISVANPASRPGQFKKNVLDISSAKLLVENLNLFVVAMSDYKGSALAQNTGYLFRSLRNKELANIFKTDRPYTVDIMQKSGIRGGQFVFYSLASDSSDPSEKTAKSLIERKEDWKKIFDLAGPNAHVLLAAMGQAEAQSYSFVFDTWVNTDGNFKMLTEILGSGLGKDLQSIDLYNIENEEDAKNDASKAATIFLKYEDQILKAFKKHHFVLYLLAKPYINDTKDVLNGVKNKEYGSEDLENYAR